MRDYSDANISIPTVPSLLGSSVVCKGRGNEGLEVCIREGKEGRLITEGHMRTMGVRVC